MLIFSMVIIFLCFQPKLAFGNNPEYSEKSVRLDSIRKKLKETNIKKFINLHCPEKIWVICHPFVVSKTLKITNKALQLTQEITKDPDLDGDISGGQVDAFRHGIWMALLTRNIGYKKAISLGKAHEKANKIDYKKSKLEEGALPDSASCEMDLRNNRIGAKIGTKFSVIDENELINIIKVAIINGQFWKIKKDNKRNFLDCNGNLLNMEEYHRKWINNKCIVNSNL
jgi:hypothetical protein